MSNVMTEAEYWARALEREETERRHRLREFWGDDEMPTLRTYLYDEPATQRYQDRLRGIERRWDGWLHETWRRKRGYTAWHMILNIPDPSRYLS